MKITKNLFLLVSLVFIGFACKSKSEAPAAKAELSQPTRQVNLAIWTNFVTDDMLKAFTEKTGIKVQVSNYSSNEELLAKLQAGAEGYDLAVPSDYMVVAMRELGLLTPMDQSKISHFSELNPKVLGKYFDPKNEFSAPFSWGTTGIAINQKLTKSNIRGWKDLFENKEISGKFTLLDDVRETLGAALKAQAISLNSKTLTELEKGKKLLVSAKKRVKGFTSETLAGLVNGEMAVAHAYSVDALMASSKTQGSIQYIIPEEGCTLWIDNLVIPKGAKNINEAYELLNFLLSAEIGAERSQKLFSAPSNLKSVALLSDELKNNKSLFPAESTLAKCEMLEDLGESLALWDRIWTEVKAGSE